ncbi:MAG: nodulation protein NfeD [Elusimicrobiota bacterium]
MKKVFPIILFSCLVLLLCQDIPAKTADKKIVPTPPQSVYILSIKGIINPVIAEYISTSLDDLKKKPDTTYFPVLITLDTPGGLMDSMHQIVQSILNHPAPVIVWVGPSGASAASAGVFITMASDIAAMAPGTNIGAAHPVQMGTPFQPSAPETKDKKEKKSQETVMGEKITNYAASYMRSIASDKKRNWKWAEQSVTKSLSITDREALNQKVIEFISKDEQELLSLIDGKQLTKLGRKLTLKTKDSIQKKIDMTPFKRFLNLIANPNIAFILLTIGIYGLIYEFASPGVGLGAIIGGISLILAFFALQMLPVNTAGLLLLILGIILMALEVKLVSGGLLTIGGIISFIIGALMLFDVPDKVLRVSLSVMVTVALSFAAFFFFALGAVIRTRLKKPVTGIEEMLGMSGVAKTDFAPEQGAGIGMVFVHGELWEARSRAGDSIKAGDDVEVVEVAGNLLTVKKRGSQHPGG